MSDVIYEPAKETASKIRKELKKEFPGVKFSVRSSTYSGGSSVNVDWTDGPMQDQVDKVLNRFKSGHFDGMQDMYISGCYEYEGKKYNGAKFVHSSRKMSAELKQEITDQCREMFDDFDDEYRIQYDRIKDVERIMKGLEPERIIMLDDDPEPPKNNVVNFAEAKAEKEFDNFTPEQRFKLYILGEQLGKEEVSQMLINTNYDIDQIFKLTAEFAVQEGKV